MISRTSSADDDLLATLIFVEVLGATLLTQFMSRFTGPSWHLEHHNRLHGGSGRWRRRQRRRHSLLRVPRRQFFSGVFSPPLFIKASLFPEKPICHPLIDDARVQSGLSEHYKLFRVLLLALTFILVYSHLCSCNSYNPLGTGAALHSPPACVFAAPSPAETNRG